MRIQVDDNKSQVLIWMTNADQADEAQQKELQSLYQRYSAKKYMVAVFQSGQEDLASLTSHLLCHNRICTAKAELRRAEEEKQEDQKQQYQGPTMLFG